jgi:hypothetical protein
MATWQEWLWFIALGVVLGVIFWSVVLPAGRMAKYWLEDRIDLIASTAEFNEDLAESMAELKAAELNRRTARLNRETAQDDAAAKVLANLVKDRTAAESGVIKAEAAARTRVIDAKAAAKAKAAARRYDRWSSGLRKFALDVRLWASCLLAVLLVVGLVLFGLGFSWYKLSEAYNRPHQLVVLVCSLQVPKVATDVNPPTIVTSAGEFLLDPGFYGPTYYGKPHEAASFFQAKKSYQLTFHGGLGWGLYVTGADTAPDTGKSCG